MFLEKLCKASQRKNLRLSSGHQGFSAWRCGDLGSQKLKSCLGLIPLVVLIAGLKQLQIKTYAYVLLTLSFIFLQ
jgi:hypothetical protein